MSFLTEGTPCQAGCVVFARACKLEDRSKLTNTLSKNELLVGNLDMYFMLCSHFRRQIVSHGISNVYLFHFQLLCGQAAVIGFVWMAHLKRCSRSHSREPEPKPIPTPGTAPTRLPRLLNRAAKRVGCTSRTPLGR